MNDSDINALGRETAIAIKGVVEPLTKRIDDLERRLIDFERRNVELKTPATIFGKGGK